MPRDILMNKIYLILKLWWIEDNIRIDYYDYYYYYYYSIMSKCKNTCIGNRHCILSIVFQAYAMEEHQTIFENMTYR